MQLLHDQIWLVILLVVSGTLLGFLLFFIAYKLFQIFHVWMARGLGNKKEIAYKVITDTYVVSLEEEEKGDVQVLFDGIPISKVRLVILKIWNSGEVTIRPEDFIRPIKFNFGREAKILEAKKLEAHPETIGVSLLRGETDLIVEPLLLKSKDSLNLKVLLTGFKGDIHVDARIVGVGINLIDRTEYFSTQNTLVRSSNKKGGKSLIGL